MTDSATPPFTKLSAAELDAYAWRMAYSWSGSSQERYLYHGADCVLLLRHFLIDKISRALRSALDPERFEFERHCCTVEHCCAVERGDAPKERMKHYFDPPGITSALRLVYHRSANLLRGVQARSLTRTLFGSKPRLCIPIAMYRQLGRTAAALQRHTSLFVPAPCSTDLQEAYHIPQAMVGRLTREDITFVSRLHGAVETGLASFGIRLLEQDAILLEYEIAEIVQRIKHTRATLEMVRPQALLSFVDNHSPILEYVLISRMMDIPFIMLQHGLDCEPYMLDEAYAAAIAVWGKSRAERYRSNSTFQPQSIEVVGNPEYDDRRPPTEIELKGSVWLWMTRPHASRKCYLPSRWPDEGILLFDALADAMDREKEVRLVIKPHPFDYREIYAQRAKDRGIAHRVTLTTSTLEELLPNSRIVICEDSTAGLDAMFWGKTLVHAHFAAVPPMLPFVQYGAALPGFSKEQLIDSTKKATLLSKNERDRMLEGQRAFMHDFAGPVDGRATDRMKAFVISQIERGVSKP